MPGVRSCPFVNTDIQVEEQVFCDVAITADLNGGILGSLFCSLASQKVKLAGAKSAQNLTKAAHRSGLSTKGVGFAVPARQIQTMQAGPCRVLDLVLGPLHLNLLGLIVDLNQVHLQITGRPERRRSREPLVLADQPAADHNHGRTIPLTRERGSGPPRRPPSKRLQPRTGAR